MVLNHLMMKLNLELILSTIGWSATFRSLQHPALQMERASYSLLLSGPW